MLFFFLIGDREQFQRYVSALHPYYSQYKLESVLKYQIRGLHLLFLLVENRLGDFHAELELMSEEDKQQPAISFCIQLDRHLMMGSYKEVISEAATPPFSHYTFFLRSLLETVRDNIVECISASYKNLTVAGAKEILMFSSNEETMNFILYLYYLYDIYEYLALAESTEKAHHLPSKAY